MLRYFRGKKFSVPCLTAYMAGGVVQLALALFFATMMVFKVKGESVFKGAMFFPYLICGIAVGFIFKFFYARGAVLDTILQGLGMNIDNIPGETDGSSSGILYCQASSPSLY